MYLSQSETARELLKQIFPQAEEVQESSMPIYVNYSVPFYEFDSPRVVIYDSATVAPRYFLGDNEVIRTQGFNIVVADKDSKVAYDRLNTIAVYLKSKKQIDDIIQIRITDDIEPMGINSKKYYLYSCNFVMYRTK
jgi:hypothetical protein